MSEFSEASNVSVCVDQFNKPNKSTNEIEQKINYFP